MSETTDWRVAMRRMWREFREDLVMMGKAYLCVVAVSVPVFWLADWQETPWKYASLLAALPVMVPYHLRRWREWKARRRP